MTGARGGSGWRIERSTGSAADHHGRPLPDPLGRTVWVHEVDRPALVLGSTQPLDLVGDASGVEVVRRHSGGGAVLLHPGGELWVDVLLPAGDPLWQDDVGDSFLWLGETWAAALAELGIEATVHRGAMERTEWSSLVCYAGRGPGEVFVEAARGSMAKVVGIAQRRTRAGARFQCAALLEPWRPAQLLDLLVLTDEDRQRAAADLAGVAKGLALEPAALLSAFVGRLP